MAGADNHDDPLPPRELVPGAAVGAVELALRVKPVIVLTGARQTGKTILARQFAKRDGRPTYTLDDPDTRERARTDPIGLRRCSFAFRITMPAGYDNHNSHL